MVQHFLGLDFGSGKISAAMAQYDENSLSFRVRRCATVPCPAISACYILDLQGAVQALSNLFDQFEEEMLYSATVAVGLRGNFLSFKRTLGFKTIESKNHIVSPRDVSDALEAACPSPLPEGLEEVNLLPQTYHINNIERQNPVGLAGNLLEAQAFLSLAESSHLHNLNRALEKAGCPDFEAIPVVLPLGETLLKPEEKRSGVLLLDIGARHSSAILYHAGYIHEAWELPLGADLMLQEVARVLQTEPEDTRQSLCQYTYGDDEFLDDVLDEAAKNMFKQILPLLTTSAGLTACSPSRIVLCGGGADIPAKNAAKSIFGVNRVRLASHERLTADARDLLAPSYTSALSLALYSQRHGAGLSVQPQSSGFLSRLLEKLGFN